jgi:hypothetical protein
MHPLAKKIGLLVSLFCLIIGLFLLGYNLRFIPENATSVAINLWPVLLVGAGIVLVVDSAKKRSFTRSAGVETHEYGLPVPPGVRELACRVQFSYGRLFVGAASGEPRLWTEQVGLATAPAISAEAIGAAASVSLSMSQPIFPAHFQLHNTWRLSLPPDLPLRLALDLHEASLFLDLREVAIDSLEMKAGTGQQEIFFCRPSHKLSARLYSSSADLTIVLPARTFARVRLLNPFCRVDYPQGDLEKREDGSLVSTTAVETAGSVDVDIDGPIKNLVLDVEDLAPAREVPRPGTRGPQRRRQAGSGRAAGGAGSKARPSSRARRPKT